MSSKHISAAWSITGMDPMNKLVLLCLSDGADRRGLVAMSQRDIAAMTGMSEVQLLKSLFDLENFGAIAVQIFRSDRIVLRIDLDNDDQKTSEIPVPPDAPIKGAIGGRVPLSSEERSLVFRRDGRKCSYCGDRRGPFHIDHILPVSLGGTNDIENLTVACASCNLSKGAKTLDEWWGVRQ